MIQTPELEAALKRARERGQIRIAELADDPDYLTAPQMAARMGISEAELMNGVELEFVLALDLKGYGLRFPVWQLGDNGKPLPGIEELIEECESQSWRVARFLTSNKGDMLNHLREGRVEEVLRIAESWNRGDFL